MWQEQAAAYKVLEAAQVAYAALLVGTSEEASVAKTHRGVQEMERGEEGVPPVLVCRIVVSDMDHDALFSAASKSYSAIRGPLGWQVEIIKGKSSSPSRGSSPPQSVPRSSQSFPPMSPMLSSKDTRPSSPKVLPPPPDDAFVSIENSAAPITPKGRLASINESVSQFNPSDKKNLLEHCSQVC